MINKIISKIKPKARDNFLPSWNYLKARPSKLPSIMHLQNLSFARMAKKIY